MTKPKAVAIRHGFFMSYLDIFYKILTKYKKCDTIRLRNQLNMLYGIEVYFLLHNMLIFVHTDT